MNLTDSLQKWGQPDVLVIGDLILDQYIWGEVNRVSPEAPIQVLNVKRKEIRLGGSANVCHNLVTLGARVSCLGVIGRDASGFVLRQEMQRLKINTAGVKTVPGKITPVKTRIIAQRQQILRMDQEDIQPLAASVEKLLSAYLKKHIKKYNLLIISDYRKGVCTPELLRAIFREARKNKIMVIVDPKGDDYRKYRGANGLAPNRAEAELATGLKITDERSRRQAAQKLIKELNLDFMIITLGEKGIYFLDKNGREIYDPAKVLEVYDVSGAGDTVMAALGIGLVSGLDMKDAIHLANLAAGVAVSKLGTATVTRDEIVRHWDNLCGNSVQISNKIVKIAELAKILLEIKKEEKKKVVFTNGCFDILHPGHVQLLEFARVQGALLVVGLNSDRSVRRLKGPARPIFTEIQRARTLSALVAVDYVVIFDELTPLNLIKKIKPDVLVKGADWRGKKVVGEEIIKARGGQVLFAPLVKGVSTTNTISRF
ncbi:MAG: D-glycero-beta-D-manno-heptose-7-phosphate kinase [Planctomycetota bacterium]